MVMTRAQRKNHKSNDISTVNCSFCGQQRSLPSQEELEQRAEALLESVEYDMGLLQTARQMKTQEEIDGLLDAQFSAIQEALEEMELDGRSTTRNSGKSMKGQKLHSIGLPTRKRKSTKKASPKKSPKKKASPKKSPKKSPAKKKATKKPASPKKSPKKSPAKKKATKKSASPKKSPKVKRALSAYNVFLKDEGYMKKGVCDMSGGAKKWNSMSKKQKEKYQAMADKQNKKLKRGKWAPNM